MNNYTPSSELQRAAEEQERNMDRRIAWARRVFYKTGRWPRLSPKRFEQHHTNAAIVKFPRRKHQIIGARQPEPPEAA